ncbi:MAG: secretin and TonB N-terminal domain-containing protein [Candidatus Omnitrophica bacterium]|nr:secretin and TonB N-terminal domain-containing protein [Candidatus Omnitrophota bacterium]
MNRRPAFLLAASFLGIIISSRIATFAESKGTDQAPAARTQQTAQEQQETKTEVVDPASGPEQTAEQQQIKETKQPESKLMPEQPAPSNETKDTPKNAVPPADSKILVSLDFKEAEIADVLSALAKAYGLNIIAGKEITGKVSVSLKDVTLEKALEAILGLNKYAYIMEGNIITIVAEDQSLKTEVLRLEFSEASDVSDLFKNVMTEAGDLKINEKVNELIITDTASGIEKAKDLLYKVDIPPPQVIIEAKLVDIDPKDLANLGADVDINYSAVLSEGTHTWNFDYNLPGPSGSLSGDDIVSSFTTPLFTPSNSFTFDSLMQKTKANLLSAPRVAVLNNQAAKIVIGEKVGIREQTQTASGTIESVRFVDVGITLKVTPTINRAGFVTMEITTEVSSISSFVDNLPRITTREASTFVRVPDRQTIVIAGLLKDEYSETASSLPLFSHIPILGQILGNFANSRETKELVIFLTPHILYSADRVNPEDKEALARQLEEKDGAEIKHEQLISPFRKDGIQDALDLPVTPHEAQDKNYFERAEWFENAARHKYDSRRFRNVQRQYYREAASSYHRFAEAHPKDALADDALNRSAELYESKLNNLPQAYEVYRYIVTEQPGSGYADNALRQMEKLKKRMESEAKRLEKRQKDLHERLDILEVSTEEVGKLAHAEIPVSGT